jgi:hypothetical protein
VCEIFDEEEGIGRCGNPGMFAPAGELCVPNSNECCPGAGEGHLYCHETYFGVERCLLCKLEGTDCSDDSECCGGSCEDGSCADGSCTPSGDECATADECCDGPCTPDAEGVLRCQLECVPVEDACTSDADCCTGNCNFGICDDEEVECIPVGITAAVCETDADCCDGLCNTDTGNCYISIR